MFLFFLESLKLTFLILCYASIIFAPVFIALNRQLDPKRFSIIEILSWASLVLSLCWGVIAPVDKLLTLLITPIIICPFALILSLGKKKENQNTQIPTQGIKHYFWEFIFISLAYSYGVFFYSYGFWAILVCGFFLTAQPVIFYELSKHRGYTAVYAVLNVTSIIWILSLNGYRNEGSGSQTMIGTLIYIIFSVAAVYIARFVHKPDQQEMQH